MNKKISIVLLLTVLTLSIFSTSSVFNLNAKIGEENKAELFEPKTSNGWYNVSLPLGAIPETTLNFTKNDETISFTINQILNYTTYENQTFPLVHFVVDKDGPVELIGFNPLYLMEIAGWYDVFNFTVNAKDGYSKQVNVTQLLLADGEFVKYTDTENETILILIWDGQWLADYKDSYGDFYLWGENLEGSQKVKNISSITYGDPWRVNLFVNGEKQAYLDSTNSTSQETGNYTTYEWGYYDDDAGYGWDNRECTGFTVESLLKHTNITDENYEIRFISYDGYGAQKSFNKTQIETGFSGIMINDPPVELSNEGKQAMIMEKQDNENLGYRRGPYQLIIPGSDKSNYIGGIVEIRITILADSSDNPSSSKIPGYSNILIIIYSIGAIISIFKKYKK